MNIVFVSIMIIIMTVSGTFGALFFKRSVNGQTKLTVLNLLFSTNLYIGGAFYLLGSVLNIVLLRYLDYSLLYPMTALTYIWSMIVAYFTLDEKINRNKLLAIFFIVVGVIILNIN